MNAIAILYGDRFFAPTLVGASVLELNNVRFNTNRT